MTSSAAGPAMGPICRPSPRAPPGGRPADDLHGPVRPATLALATGLGLNAFVALAIASQMTWADAMGLVVLEHPHPHPRADRLPDGRVPPCRTQLKVAISVGIGLFIALIGFVDAGFVRRTATGPVPVQLGTDGFINGWPTFVFVLGLVLVVILWVRKIKGRSSSPSWPDDPRDHRRGHRQDRPDGRRRQKVNRPAGTSSSRGCPRTSSRRPSWTRLVTSRSSAPSGGSASSGHPVDLHPDARRLLRHHGDDDGHRRQAGLLDEEGLPPNTTKILVVDSIAAAAGGAAGVSSNTSLHRVGLGRR